MYIEDLSPVFREENSDRLNSESSKYRAEELRDLVKKKKKVAFIRTI